MPHQVTAPHMFNGMPNTAFASSWEKMEAEITAAEKDLDQSGN